MVNLEEAAQGFFRSITEYKAHTNSEEICKKRGINNGAIIL